MKAWHYRIPVRGKDGKEHRELVRTACGLSGPVHLAAYDPRDADCLKCRKTVKYRKAMKG